VQFTSVVERPVADIFEARFGQVVQRLESLRQPGAEPAARLVAADRFDGLDGLADIFALIVDLVHRDLFERVGIEFPARFQAGFDDARVFGAGAAVHGHRALEAHVVEQLAQPPEADAHAVFVP